MSVDLAFLNRIAASFVKHISQSLGFMITQFFLAILGTGHGRWGWVKTHDVFFSLSFLAL